MRPFPDVDSGRWQVSSGGGVWPLWSAVSDELFYIGREDAMVLDFTAEPTFTPGSRTAMFSREPYGRGGNRRWAVAPDGQRFLLLKPAASTVTDDADAPPPQIILVQNFFEELKARVPVP